MKLTKSRLNRAMTVTTFAGTGGAVWYLIATPQAIFNVFFTNHLGATSAQLGLLLAVMQICGVFHLVSIYAYAKLSRKKPYWLLFHSIHRTSALIIAAVAFRVAATGVRAPGITVIIFAMAGSFVFANISASGWWSWMADLIPENIRAGFFGKRSAVLNVANIVCFLSVSILLDTLTSVNIFRIYGWVFAVTGVLGIMDVLTHIFVHEPRSSKKSSGMLSKKEFFEPVRDKNFIRFSLAVGLALFSVQVFAPFSAPYITSSSEIGAPNTWLGIMFVMSQLTWVLVAPTWGLVMDRFGRKPVVITGLAFTLSWTGYFFLTSTNYTYILPLIAITGGLVAPGFWEGVNQMMLSLTPQENRVAYVAWYNTLIGLVAAGGSYFGGWMKDRFSHLDVPFLGGFHFKSIHLVLMISILLISISQLVLSRIKEGRGKSLGYVLNQLVRPGIFRTMINVGVLGSTGGSDRIVKALRSIDGESDHLVIDEVIGRLLDPSSDVREEAARTLGRIGTPEAVDALIDQLADPASTVRTEAAQSLGRIGDQKALPYLIGALDDNAEELQNASAKALGNFTEAVTVSNLLRLFKETRSERVIAAGAESISKLGALEAAWEIIPRMHETANPVLKRQLAISAGNLLGTPGEFYRFLSGSESARTSYIKRMFTDSLKGLQKLLVNWNLASLREEFSDRLKKVRSTYFDEEYREGVIELLDTVRRLLALRYEPGLSREEYLDKTFQEDPKFGIWWWFLQEVEGALDRLDEELIHTDLLLGVYYLSSLSGPTPQNPR